MKIIIQTDQAPAPVGPYNQAIKANGMLFISGQIALDPATGDLLMADIEQETHQVMKNLKAVLNEAGLGFEHLVSCSVFVVEMGLYSRINAVYSEYFDDATAPSRALVEVSNLPKYVNIEISGIAVFPG